MIASTIIAHRGLSSLAPENTFVAVKATAKIGATWVEIDIQLLKDDTPVVLHDNDLFRTTDGEGMVYDHTIETIETIDAGSWFDEHFKGEKLPTLKEMLEVIEELNLGLIVEVKYCLGYHDDFTKKQIEHTMHVILTQLQRSPAPPRGLIISSSYAPFLKEIRKQNNKINIGCLYSTYDKDYLTFAKSIQAVSIHLERKILLDDIVRGTSMVEKIKQENMDVYVYTVNEETDAKKLFDMGIDGIFTDYPQIFPRYLP